MDTISLRESALYTGNQYDKLLSIRKILKLDRGSIHLHAKYNPFSIIFYNMALIVSPGTYKRIEKAYRERPKYEQIIYEQTIRNNVIFELIKQIKINPPDVVGLCEVFADGERDKIRKELSDIYPFYQEGPDEHDWHSDGGLLILSKYPFIASHHSIYRQSASDDGWANKGVIFIRVHPLNSPTPWNIFFSHMQDISVDGGEDALYAQLTHFGHMIEAYADPYAPTLIVGDLNIPSEIPKHYNQMLNRLGMPVDLWKTKNPHLDGFTNTVNNNFYGDPDDVPSEDNRLDYMLLKAGQQFIPILRDMDILKWSYSGKQISDHYGLYAKFEQSLEVGIEISGTISKVTAIITGFRCIEETDEVGSDEVSFSLSMNNQYNKFIKIHTHITEKVDYGEYHNIVGMKPIVLKGDPGQYITIKVAGTEHDDDSFWNPDDSLGSKSITVLRNDLLLNKGQSFKRIMPYLTGDGGEYGVEIEVFVE